jgi:hypothetical protein
MNASTIAKTLLEDDSFDPNDPMAFIYHEIENKHHKIDSIHVVGRRWFQRTYGNTYHVADIYVNDKLVHTTPMEYGYGDQFQWTAAQWLEDNGYIKRERSKNGSCDPMWVVAERMGFKYSYEVYDVRRQRDL